MANEVSIKFGWGGVGGVSAEMEAAPPLHNAAAAAAPRSPAIQGIAIAHIAPVDNPLLLDWIGIVELELKFELL